MESTDPRPLALVTGASSGIGRALALELADRGHDLLIVAEDEEIERAASEARAHGSSVIAVQADLATPHGVERLASAVRDLDGPIEVCVLNAGTADAGPFVASDLYRQLGTIALNVTGTVHLARLLLPPMAERGRGRVMFTSSIAAVAPGPYQAVYHATKAFLLSFSQALRVELADAGVSVTALMPGPTDTPLFERANLEGTRVGEMDKDDAVEVARAGVDAMLAGDDHVVPGSWRNRAGAGLAKFIPAAIAARLTAPFAEPSDAGPGDPDAAPKPADDPDHG